MRPSHPNSSFFRESRADLRGITIDYDRPREAGGPLEVSLTELSAFQVLSVSLCASRQRLAFLVTRPKNVQRSVYLYKVSLLRSNFQLDSVGIKLPHGPEWKHIVHAGWNFVAWGIGAAEVKHVYYPQPEPS